MFIFLFNKKNERHFGLPQDLKKVRGKYWSSGKLENTYAMKSKGEGKIYIYIFIFLRPSPHLKSPSKSRYLESMQYLQRHFSKLVIDTAFNPLQSQTLRQALGDVMRLDQSQAGH